ncbi:MAG TPA: response regulator, partial [Pirellulaceae bacterium]|nr:response regulator [Pirellulaceae bacterium]
MALLNQHNQIVWASPQMVKWFSASDYAGISIYDALGNTTILGPETHPIISAVRRRTTTSTVMQIGDSYFRFQVQPLFEIDGPVRYLLVTMADMTESAAQRQKLHALHQAQLALCDLNPAEIFRMDVEERIELLKHNILHYTKDLLQFDVVEIRLLDERTGLLEPLLTVGIDAEASKKPLYAKPEGNGVTGWVVSTGHSYLCEDTTTDPLYLDGLIGAKSSLTVPLKVQDKIIGSFNVESPEVNAFDQEDLEFLESFARGVAAALNTMELLVAQRTDTAIQSIEAIHNAVAIPIDKILNDVVWMLESYVGHDEMTTNRLREIRDNARRIKHSIQKVGESLAPTESVPATRLDVRPELKGKRILVIDADEQVRTTAHQMLERYGCQVETSFDPQHALLLVRNCQREDPYDAIIADIRLEGMNGYEIYARLQQHFSSPPLILMTGPGYDPEHAIVRARQAGLPAHA